MKKFTSYGIGLFIIVALGRYAPEVFVALGIYYLMGFFCMAMWYIDAIGEDHGTSRNMFLRVSLWPFYFISEGIKILLSIFPNKHK